MADGSDGTVVSVSAGPEHGPHKPTRPEIRLLEGRGVEGDAHLGPTVKHRSRKAQYPGAPNLRQVHLIGVELLSRLKEDGFNVGPGEIGENVTTAGLDLLSMPRGTRLRLGASAVVELTGLRNPCTQLDGVQEGLMKATLGRDANGALVRKAGVMGVVVVAGSVMAGDSVGVELPAEPAAPLEPV